MSAVLKPALRQIAAMTLADIGRVIEIENDIYEFPWTTGNFTDSIQAGYHCRLVLDGDVIIAYAVVMHGAGEAHVLNLSVRRSVQRRGVGSFLLSDLLTTALALGAQKMLLEVRPSNSAGRALYDKAGFVQLGVRKAYYPTGGGREDALVLGRDLKGA